MRNTILNSFDIGGQFEDLLVEKFPKLREMDPMERDAMIHFIFGASNIGSGSELMEYYEKIKEFEPGIKMIDFVRRRFEITPNSESQ